MAFNNDLARESGRPGSMEIRLIFHDVRRANVPSLRDVAKLHCLFVMKDPDLKLVLDSGCKFG